MLEGRSNKLIRNLERRGQLQKKLIAAFAKRKGLDVENNHVAGIKVKDNFTPLLETRPHSIYKRIQGHGLSSSSGKLLEEEAIKTLNRRLFLFLNRLAALSDKNVDTSAISAMYAFQSKGANKIHNFPNIAEIKSFFAFLAEEGISVKSITGMQAGLGMPKLEDLDKLSTWCKTTRTTVASYCKSRIGLGIGEEILHK
jgi:hypothetical protein